jgi:hypothetical protein
MHKLGHARANISTTPEHDLVATRSRPLHAASLVHLRVLLLGRTSSPRNASMAAWIDAKLLHTLANCSKRSSDSGPEQLHRGPEQLHRESLCIPVWARECRKFLSTIGSCTQRLVQNILASYISAATLRLTSRAESRIICFTKYAAESDQVGDTRSPSNVTSKAEARQSSVDGVRSSPAK